MPSSTQGTITAPWFPGVFNPSLSQFQTFQQQGPSILDIYQNMPQLQVPGLDPTQTNVLNQLVSTGTNDPQLQQALAQLSQLTSGPIGSSPATQAGMQAFQQLEAPIIEQQSALRGTAGGGQAIEALGQGATQAALPLIQSEIAAREAAVGQYGQLGQQHISQLATALEAAGLPREVALEQAQAAYQQQQQKSQLALGLQTMPLQYLGELGIGTRTSTPSNIWGDVLGAVGPALAALAVAA